MKYLHIFIFSIFLISCGGGSSSANINTGGSGSAPTGNISGQVDPVQST